MCRMLRQEQCSPHHIRIVHVTIVLSLKVLGTFSLSSELEGLQSTIVSTARQKYQAVDALDTK